MLIASSIALIRRYARYRSQLTSISQLDERTLRDIGISRQPPHGAIPRASHIRNHLLDPISKKEGPRHRGPSHVGLE
jgi:uncharacterized protein YjiS (DUF1127 family)